MAKTPDPIDHNITSSVLTTASSAANWGGAAALLGIALSVALPVVLGVATVAITWSLLSAGGFGILGGVAVAVGGTVATLASVPTSLAGTGVAAAGGGLFGAIRGGSRVRAEMAAHKDATNDYQDQLTANLNNQRIVGRQEGYVMAAQDPELKKMFELQAAQEKQKVGPYTDKAVEALNNAATRQQG